MTHEEAIQILRHIVQVADTSDCGIKEIDGIDEEAIDMAIKTLEQTQWIPVSESPKELGTYLIQTDGEPYMCQCRWTDVNPFWTDYKTKPHWNIFDLPQYSKVVAWMPLPKPYKPQDRKPMYYPQVEGITPMVVAQDRAVSLNEWHEQAKDVKYSANNSITIRVKPQDRTISREHFENRVREAVGLVEEELSDDFKDGIMMTLELLKTEPSATPQTLSVCDICMYGNPSSSDGKPCTMCPAITKVGDDDAR